MRVDHDILLYARIQTVVDDQHRRRHKLFPASTSSAGNPAGVAILCSISEPDVLIQTDALLMIGELVEINLLETDRKTAKIIWLDDRLAGCEFVVDAKNVQEFGGTFSEAECSRSLPQLFDMNESVSIPLIDAVPQDFSLGARLRIIILSSLLLWMVIGVLAFGLLK